MELIVCWVAFPLLLAVLCEGAGALVQRAAGRRLRLALRLPCGFGLIVVICDLATRTPTTSRLAVPLVLAVAAAGFGLWHHWPPQWPDRWALGTGTAAFAALAAPVVLSGQATFTGYIKLDDTATWLAFVDHVLEHGRNATGLAPSSYEATLALYLATSYPLGSFLPIGIGPWVLGQDPAWLVAPYLAVVGAILALALYVISERVVRVRWQRALASALAAQAALLYGYGLWGGIKELVGAALAATFAAAAPLAFEAQGSPGAQGRPGPPGAVSALRAALPAVVVALASVSALSVGGLVWVAPTVAVLAVCARRARAGSRLSWLSLRTAPGRAGAGLALALTAVGWSFLGHGFLARNLPGLTNADLGNLIRPLSWLQIFGIWPAGDFRLNPVSPTVAQVLIAAAAVAASLGIVGAVRVRAWGLLGYLAAAICGATLIGATGSPWVAGKALAIASPALVLAAGVGVAALAGSGRRVQAAAIGLALGGGVLWSNALAWRDVNLAPRPRMAELEGIGRRIAGQGPTLMTDYEPDGVRHFLRRADAEGASELRRRALTPASGQALPKGKSADIDQFGLSSLAPYRTLVLRRSPLASLPPLSFALRRRGRYYDVYQRSGGAPAVLAHLPLGSGTDPAAAPDCRAVAALARTPGSVALAAPLRIAAPTVVSLSGLAHPRRWANDSATPGALALAGAGSVRIPLTGSSRPTRVWVGGSIPSELKLSAQAGDGGSVRDELQYPGQYVRLGTIPANAGSLVLAYSGHDLHPGSGAVPASAGPVVLDAGPAPRILRVSPGRYRELCGRRLDWVEALGSQPQGPGLRVASRRPARRAGGE